MLCYEECAAIRRISFRVFSILYIQRPVRDIYVEETIQQFCLSVRCLVVSLAVRPVDRLSVCLCPVDRLFATGGDARYSFCVCVCVGTTPLHCTAGTPLAACHLPSLPFSYRPSTTTIPRRLSPRPAGALACLFRQFSPGCCSGPSGFRLAGRSRGPGEDAKQALGRSSKTESLSPNGQH